MSKDSVGTPTRRNLDGEPAQRFEGATRLLLDKAIRLCDELKGLVKPRAGVLDVTLNDRVLFPHSDEVDTEMRPLLDGLLKSLYGDSSATVTKETDSQQRLGYRCEVAGQENVTFQELRAKL